MASRTSWFFKQLKASLAWLVRHPHYKILSIVFGVGVWLYVQGKQVVNERVRAEVEWVTPVTLLSTQELPSTVAINVEGSLSAVRKAKRAEVTLLADLSEATVGETTVDFASLAMKGMPSNVRPTAYAPSSIRFILDEASNRKVAVSPVLVGEPSHGYEVASVTLDPAVVEVRGPRITLAEIKELDTKPVDISELAGDSDLPAEVDLPRGVELVEETMLLARVDLETVIDVKTFTGVKVLVDQAGWVAEPNQVVVRLKGPAAATRNVTVDELLVVAKLPEVTEEQHYTVPHGLTEGVRLDLSYPGEQLEETVIPQKIEVWRR